MQVAVLQALFCMLIFRIEKKERPVTDSRCCPTESSWKITTLRGTNKPKILLLEMVITAEYHRLLEKGPQSLPIEIFRGVRKPKVAPGYAFLGRTVGSGWPVLGGTGHLTGSPQSSEPSPTPEPSSARSHSPSQTVGGVIPPHPG